MSNEKKERPQDRWNEKNNYISKSYKMRKEVADDFKVACDKAGVSQSGQIVKMIQDFIRQQNS